MPEAGDFWQHVVQASLPVLKICILGSVGALLAACGVLDQQGRRTLSKLIYFLFTPCLTFSKLAPVLTAQHLLLWMPIALNMFVSVGMGLVLGVLLLLVVGAPPWFRKHVIVSTALGNAGNLPLVLVAALLKESEGVLFRDQDVSVDLSIAYVAMGIWAATITHFTVGTHLLKLPAWREDPSHSSRRSSSSSCRCGGTKSRHPSAVLRYKTPAATANDEPGQKQQHIKESEVVCQDRFERRIEPGSISSELCEAAAICSVELMSPASFTSRIDSQHNHQQQHQHRHEQREEEEEGEELNGMHAFNAAAAPAARGFVHVDEGVGTSDTLVLEQQQDHQQPSGKAQTDWRTLSASVSNFLRKPMLPQKQQQSFSDLEHGEDARLLSCSQYSSSSSSMFLGLTMSLQDAAAAAGKVLWAQVSPPMVGCLLAVVVGMTAAVRDQLFAPGGQLLMIQDCINMFSDCCIPCLLLMMGATLSKGPGKACPPWRVVLGVGAARLVLLPLLGTTWIVLAQIKGWLGAPDSIFLLVMLIQNAVPTALNVHTLATLHANREEEVGALLFWQYLAACVTVPVALMSFLWLLKTPMMAVTAGV